MANVIPPSAAATKDVSEPAPTPEAGDSHTEEQEFTRQEESDKSAQEEVTL